MRVRNHLWILNLAILLAAGTALAADIEGPATATEEVEVGLETQTEPSTLDEDLTTQAVGGEAEPIEQGFGSSQPGFTCSCECTCPTSGAFEVQTFTLPLWTNRSCKSFNGDSCDIGPFDTCNTFRSYANCVTL
ncbi:MAG: hypothetical protein AAF657_27590 [Acidobacteriota bacterium]